MFSQLLTIHLWFAEHLEEEIQHLHIGRFPTQDEFPAFGRYGLLGNGLNFVTLTGEFASTLLRHPFAEHEKMNKYKEEYDEVRDMMLTMKDMKAGQPSVQLLLTRNCQYFV